MPSDLQRLSNALLALHGCQTPDELSGVILQALQALGEAESHAVNVIGSGPMSMYAATVDYSAWDIEVFNLHLAEHPLLWVIEQGQAGLQPTGRWSDHITLRQFRQMALYHDFFRLTGTQHQIAGAVWINSQLTLGLSLNRSRRDFRQEDVELLAALLPHVQQVVQTMAGRLEVEQALALRELASADEACLIATERGALLYVTERARQLLHDYFPAAPPHQLPLELHGWLQGGPSPQGKFTCTMAGRRLVCTGGNFTPWPDRADKLFGVADATPTRVCRLRLQEQHESHTSPALRKLGLTPREVQVLQWIAQGKRNGEVAIILGASERTIAKHCEHIFTKLGTETRTAAVSVFQAAL